MDSVHDQLVTGRKLRVLTIVDTFSRLSPALDVRFNFRGADAVEVLEQLGAVHGFPAGIRVDQGSEFISRDLDLWAYTKGVTLDFSRPGKPTVTDVVEKPFQAGAGVFFAERDWARGFDPSRGETGVRLFGLLDAHPLSGPLLRDVVIVGRTTLGVLVR